jgi:hypothetical protein
MKIKKVPLEYGWDWHLNSYRFIKENFKDYLFIGFFFIVNLLFIRLIPYVGHFIAAATLVPLIHVLYATFEEKSTRITSSYYPSLFLHSKKMNTKTSSILN